MRSGRKRINLDGKWRFDMFGCEPEDLAEVEPGRTIDVPACVERYFPAVTREQFYLYYERSFELAKRHNRRYFLHFGAVDYLCKVFLNGEKLGEHIGGYLPFEFEITQLILDNNRLQILVFDPIGGGVLDNRKIPHGKQNGEPNWYTNISGLWQSVWIEERPEVYIHDLKIEASYLQGRVRVSFKTDSVIDGAVLTLLDRKGDTISSKRAVSNEIDLPVSGVFPWSPGEPNLYDLVLEISSRGVRDRLSVRTGFKDFQTASGRLLLNGRDFYIKGVLDQDFYPETLYTVPSREYLSESFRKLKRMGINTLRHHVKVPDPLYMDLADEIGLLVWQDSPYFDEFSPTGSLELLKTIRGAIERDLHHPSLCVYSIINESWGIDLTDREQAGWLARVLDELKQDYPSIIFTDNSACMGNYHLKSDLNDYHFYASSIDRGKLWNFLIESFSNNPASFYLREYRDNFEEEPLLVSEFGNWSLPPKKWLEKRDWPHWFSHIFKNVAMTRPGGAGERFLASEIAREYSYDELFEISVENQLENLRMEIDKIRLHDRIRGFVITESSDIFWECNGLLTFDRDFKFPPERLGALLENDLFVASLESDTLWLGQEARLLVRLLKRLHGETISVESDGLSIERRIDGLEGETVALSLDTSSMSEGVRALTVRVGRAVSTVPLLVCKRGETKLKLIKTSKSGPSEPEDNTVLVLERAGMNVGISPYSARTVEKEDLLSGDWISGIFWIVKDLSPFAPGGHFRKCHGGLIAGRPMIESEGFSRRLIGITYGWLAGFYGYLDMLEGHRFVTTMNIDPSTPQGNLLLRQLETLQY